MARRPVNPIAFDALAIEGALIAPDMLGRIGAAEAGEQTEADYGLEPGAKLRDEIGFAFTIGETLWARFCQSRKTSPGIHGAERFAFDLLRQVFGFDSLVTIEPPMAEGHSFPIRYAALGGRVPVVIAPPPLENARRSGLDESHERFGDGGRKRSATLLVQEYLNAEDRAAWGIALDALTLRILRDNASMTRPAWIEANLERIFTDRLFADFSVLWLLLHESRFGQAKASPTDCPLERWRERARAEGVKARERLGDGVEAALLALGGGFLRHPANKDLCAALTEGRLDAKGYFQELLRLVYRLIFLFTAEDRGLLHPPGAPDAARKLYVEGYSLARLRERAIRRTAYDNHHDLFEGAKIAFRALASGQPKLALPALGGLFLPGTTPHLDAAKLGNRDLLTAIYRLAWLIDRDSGRIERVNWRDMETEELGSVYESLLELAPRVTSGAGGFEFAGGAEAKGNARKTSGSYYTPDSLVQLLLDSALDPVIEAAVAAKPDHPIEALLGLTVIDPACGSGHFLLAAARRIAARIAREQSPGAPSGDDYRHALREVARHCLYGVDRNPLAVELCKVALWIETVEPGKPLSFLDGRIRQGDSLIGVFDLASLADGIPDEAYKALTGDDKAVAKYYATRNRKERKDRPSLPFAGSLATLGHAAARLDAMPEDDLAGIAAKQQALATLEHSPEAWTLRVACDLFVAAFFAPKTGEVPKNPNAVTIPTTDHLWRKLDRQQLYGPLEAAAIDIASRASAFHWPLAFPEVFAKGGFDCVLGNPPWKPMSPDTKEFFSPYDGQIRFMSPDEQEARIAELLAMPGMNRAWDQYGHDLYASANFMKESGRYTLFAEGNLGKGDFNVYRMFVELAVKAVNRTGRASQFVPENLYSGANAAAIRRYLFDRCRLHLMAGFENSRKIWFADIDTRAKFCLYVASPDGKTEQFEAAFGVNSKEKLAALTSGLSIQIPVSLVEEFSPEAFAIAEVAHPSDISISRKLYSRFPKFGGAIPAAPDRKYGREMDMGNDREDFEDDPDGIPLYEGRMVEAFDHRAKKYISGRGRSSVWEEIPFGSIAKSIGPQWRISNTNVPSKAIDRWRCFRIGFCDVASPTNQRALVAAIIPANTLCGDKVPTIMFVPHNDLTSLLWIGIANSFCLDFIARKKVALKMSYTVLDSLPLPRTYGNTALEQAIARRALLLTATGLEMVPFWERVAPLLGMDAHTNSPVENPDRRAQLRAEIDVIVARDLFGLDKDEMRYLLDPEDVLGSSCGFETFGALKRAEIRERKHFATRDLIMETWDNINLGEIK
ncbi:MAG: N-6 DNA methylase [Alphaproteobacteria bacterium]|nr:N-6 DNA methylase [Alphaproteobacteria bacterium]